MGKSYIKITCTEADNEEYNVVGDEMENPFIMTQAGSQSLVIT